MNTLIFFIHLFSEMFLGATLMIGIGSYFGGEWGTALKRYAPLLKKLIWIWGICLIILAIIGKKYFPFDEFKGHKKIYFEYWFVLTRIALYFIVTLLCVLVIEKRPYLTLIGVTLCGNFFAYDWAMSLEKEWYSNMYGLLYLANGAQGAMSLMMIAGFPALSPRAKKDFLYLFLTAGIGWFYLQFSQFIILWMGNLPKEATFYLHRWTHYGALVVLFAVLVKTVMLSGIAVTRKLILENKIIKPASVLVLLFSIFEVFWLVRPL